MNKHLRKLAVGAAAVTLLVATVASMTGTSSAANLTGGTYTYVINGEETTFPFDPLVRQGGVLLPAEVYQQFGITIDGALTRNITLKKDDQVTASLTLGSTTVTVNGNAATVATAPLRLNGRLFLPGDLLKEFGVEFSSDGNYVVMRNLADGQANIQQNSESEFSGLKIGKSFTASVKADSGIFLSGDFTLLTPSIVGSANLKVTYGTRARLQNLLQTNTLIMVKLSNSAFKSGAFVTSGVMLVDDQRTQYDVLQVLDTGNGLLSNKIVPAGDRVGVLVFPKLANNASILTMYYDTQGANLGSFTSVK